VVLAGGDHVNMLDVAALTDYSQVDMLHLLHRSVNLLAGKGPGSPIGGPE